jgi:hypothetical protein
VDPFGSELVGVGRVGQVWKRSAETAMSAQRGDDAGLCGVVGATQQVDVTGRGNGRDGSISGLYVVRMDKVAAC